MPEIIFSKKEFQIWDFESFISWSRFRGLLWGVLANAFFFSFSSSASHGGWHFYTASLSPPLLPYHKKASYGSVFATRQWLPVIYLVFVFWETNQIPANSDFRSTILSKPVVKEIALALSTSFNRIKWNENYFYRGNFKSKIYSSKCIFF